MCTLPPFLHTRAPHTRPTPLQTTNTQAPVLRAMTPCSPPRSPSRPQQQAQEGRVLSSSPALVAPSSRSVLTCVLRRSATSAQWSASCTPMSALGPTTTPPRLSWQSKSTSAHVSVSLCGVVMVVVEESRRVCGVRRVVCFGQLVWERGLHPQHHSSHIFLVPFPHSCPSLFFMLLAAPAAPLPPHHQPTRRW